MQLVDAINRRLTTPGTVLQTTGRGSGVAQTHKAIEQGAELVVAVGGDGTVHEVINAILSTNRSVPLAVVPAGSGCDLARTFALSTEPDVVAGSIDTGVPRPIDAVRTDRGWFVNIGEVGLGAAVAQRAANLPRWLGPAVYGVSLAIELPRFRATSCRVTVDGNTVETKTHNVVVANCRYFGGGMQVSPQSQPDDGKLEVLIFAGPKTDAITLVPKMYKGTHLPHPNVIELIGAKISVESDDPLQIESDGESMGSTPINFEVAAGALQLLY